MIGEPFPYISETFEEISSFRSYIHELRMKKRGTVFPVPNGSYLRYFLQEMLIQIAGERGLFVKVNDLKHQIWGSFNPHDFEMWLLGCNVRFIVGKKYEDLECRELARWLATRGLIRKSKTPIIDEHIVIGGDIFVSANNETFAEGALGCVYALDGGEREAYINKLIEIDIEQWNNVL